MFWALLSILANLNDIVVWIAWIRSQISNSSNSLSKLLRTISSAPFTCGITVTLIYHGFFRSLARSKYLSLFSLSFFFTQWFAVTAKSTIQQVLFFFNFFFFFFVNYHQVRSPSWIRWSICISKSWRILCVSFSRMDSGLFIYHLVIWSNFNFLHNFLWITFPTLSCLVWYSFCASLLHSLIIGLIISS